MIARIAPAFIAALPAALAAALLAAPAAAQLHADKRADLAAPVALGPGQAAVIIGFRRPDSLSAGKSGLVAFGRYDLEKRDLVGRPKDAKKNGDSTTYAITVKSADRKLPLDHAVMIVSAGDYVLLGAAPGPVAGVMNSFCFGAPTFRVNAGETVYFGDVTPYLGVRMMEAGTAKPPTLMGIEVVDANFGNAMAYSSHPDDARAALASQPALAAGFKPAEIRNGATFGCFAQDMTAYFIPGLPDLANAAVVPASVTSAAAVPAQTVADTTPPRPPIRETPYD